MDNHVVVPGSDLEVEEVLRDQLADLPLKESWGKRLLVAACIDQ